MKIKYKSSRKEIWNFYWNQWLHGKIKWIHARLFVLIFFIIYFYNTKALIWSLPVFITAIIFGLGSIIWMPIYPQFKFKPQTRTLKISENGISTSIGKFNSEREWKDVASITESKNCIFIVGIDGNGFVVPLRAFRDIEEKKEFLGHCLNYYATSKNT